MQRSGLLEKWRLRKTTDKDKCPHCGSDLTLKGYRRRFHCTNPECPVIFIEKYGHRKNSRVLEDHVVFESPFSRQG